MEDKQLKSIWWLLLLRGLALVAFGVVAVVWPGITLAIMALAFALFIFVSGVANIIVGIGSMARGKAWFLTLILGAFEVGIGVYALRGADQTLGTFIAILGLTFIVQGIMSLVVAFTEDNDSGLRFLTVVAAIVAIVAGFVVLRYPVSSGLAFAWVVGVYGLIAGSITIALSFSVRDQIEKLKA